MLPDYRVRQRDELLEINRLITEELNLGVVLARILRVATQLLSSHAALVALHEDGPSAGTEASGGWHIAASHGIRRARARRKTAVTDRHGARRGQGGS